jgi:hypothetical protein
MTSWEPPRNSTATNVVAATPAAVRCGASRGRSSRWCSRSSFVNRRSIHGTSSSPVKMTPGMMTPE